jgi:hypothetical protein
LGLGLGFELGLELGLGLGRGLGLGLELRLGLGIGLGILEDVVKEARYCSSSLNSSSIGSPTFATTKDNTR